MRIGIIGAGGIGQAFANQISTVAAVERPRGREEQRTRIVKADAGDPNAPAPPRGATARAGCSRLRAKRDFSTTTTEYAS
jgi:ketopantoate reductase